MCRPTLLANLLLLPTHSWQHHTPKYLEPHTRAKQTGAYVTSGEVLSGALQRDGFLKLEDGSGWVKVHGR